MPDRCPIVRCTAVVMSGHFMCHPHWTLVPRPLQKTLWFLHNNGIQREGFQEALESAVEQTSAKVIRLMTKPRPVVTYRRR